ncbi:hypothetical protein A3715_19215 [Oleiphilus sp. HI0009]|nr:hypothetical protein A3715_19215 [Oleiphilus sp. HI0009]
MAMKTPATQFEKELKRITKEASSRINSLMKDVNKEITNALSSISAAAKESVHLIEGQTRTEISAFKSQQEQMRSEQSNVLTQIKDAQNVLQSLVDGASSTSLGKETAESVVNDSNKALEIEKLEKEFKRLNRAADKADPLFYKENPVDPNRRGRTPLSPERKAANSVQRKLLKLKGTTQSQPVVTKTPVKKSSINKTKADNAELRDNILKLAKAADKADPLFYKENPIDPNRRGRMTLSPERKELNRALREFEKDTGEVVLTSTPIIPNINANADKKVEQKATKAKSKKLVKKVPKKTKSSVSKLSKKAKASNPFSAIGITPLLAQRLIQSGITTLDQLVHPTPQDDIALEQFKQLEMFDSWVEAAKTAIAA